VSISRNDIDTVITEFGIARLKGKSVAERSHAMISIAHPEFRENLIFKAKQNGYI
jgi:acyl-CoA hydrolase